MEDVIVTAFTVPAIQVVILMVCSTLALLYGKQRLGLLINYVFTLYWGYFLNKDVLLGMIEGSDVMVFLYFGSGVACAMLAMLAFVSQARYGY